MSLRRTIGQSAAGHAVRAWRLSTPLNKSSVDELAKERITVSIITIAVLARRSLYSASERSASAAARPLPERGRQHQPALGDEAVVLRVRPHPEPEQPVRRVDSQRAVVRADAHGMEAFYALES